MPTFFRLLSVLAALTAEAPRAQTPASQAPAVHVPTFANSTCPIMGKRASLPLFADTEFGRIYVCCKPCIRKVHADVVQAYETAYPTTLEVANEVCPVSGEPIGAHQVSIVLQGRRLRLCCDGCVEPARQNAQVVLAKALDPKLADLQNDTCPVDGRPVQANAFAVIGTTIVRLSSPAAVAELQKAPEALLDKARATRAKQGRSPAHQHRPAPTPTPTPAPAPAPAERRSAKPAAEASGKEGA